MPAVTETPDSLRLEYRATWLRGLLLLGLGAAAGWALAPRIAGFITRP